MNRLRATYNLPVRFPVDQTPAAPAPPAASPVENDAGNKVANRVFSVLQNGGA